MPPGRPRHAGNDQDSEDTFTNLYVKNLNKNLTKSELDELFRPYGDIRSSALTEGNPGNVAFVRYASHDSAIAAIEALHGTTGTWARNKLHVSRVQSKEERAKVTKVTPKVLSRQAENEPSLFTEQGKKLKNNSKKSETMKILVRGLPCSTSRKSLFSLFKPFGEIYSIVIQLQITGGRCFGLVTFKNPASATAAGALDGKYQASLRRVIYITQCSGSEDIPYLPKLIWPDYRKEDQALVKQFLPYALRSDYPHSNFATRDHEKRRTVGFLKKKRFYVKKSEKKPPSNMRIPLRHGKRKRYLRKTVRNPEIVEPSAFDQVAEALAGNQRPDATHENSTVETPLADSVCNFPFLLQPGIARGHLLTLISDRGRETASEIATAILNQPRREVDGWKLLDEPSKLSAAIEEAVSTIRRGERKI